MGAVIVLTVGVRGSGLSFTNPVETGVWVAVVCMADMGQGLGGWIGIMYVCV